MDAWLIFVVLYVAPLVHVALARSAGPWRPAAGSACPFGPHTGWMVIVLLLGPIGWLMFVTRGLVARGGRVR